MTSRAADPTIAWSWCAVTASPPRPLRENYDDLAAKTRSACKRASLKPLVFHALRATYATIAAAQGQPLTKLSAILGHRDPAATAIHLRPEARRAAKDPRARLGGIVVASQGGPDADVLPN
jgi:integrase